MSYWKDKVAVITGGSAGLGLELASQFLRQGSSVVLAARDSGFLQIHCATCQEVVDSLLIAYRLAEDPRVRLPVIADGCS